MSLRWAASCLSRRSFGFTRLSLRCRTEIDSVVEVSAMDGSSARRIPGLRIGCSWHGPRTSWFARVPVRHDTKRSRLRPASAVAAPCALDTSPVKMLSGSRKAKLGERRFGMQHSLWRVGVAILLAIAVCVLQLPGSPRRSTMKLYVTNSEGDDITVVDLTALKVIGDIKVGKNPHGAAVQADGRRLFTTIESEGTLKIIDTATDQIVDTIKLGGRPNQCVVTPNGKFVGVPIRGSDTVSIVDIAAKRIVKTLPVAGPHNCYNARNEGHIFVTSMDGQRVNLIDLRTMSYAAEIPVGGVPRPIAVSQDEKTMYVALSDLHGFIVVDVPLKKVVATVQLPAPPAGAQPLVPHTLTHGLELSPDGKELWVTSLVSDGVYVYDVATKTLSKKIPTGKAPNWLAFSPDGAYCCVSNAGSDDCSIIDTKTRKEIARLKVGKLPKRLVVAEVGATAPR